MAADVVIKFSAEDDASKALLDIITKMHKLEEQERKLREEGEKNEKQNSKSLKMLKALGETADKAARAGLNAVAGAATAAAGAIGGLLAVGAKALSDWQEQDQVNNSLADSIRRTGVEAGEVEAHFAKLNQTAGEFASKTMFGDEDILRGMDEYIRMTGQAEVATADLSTILGIAAKAQKSTTDAAKEYAKAAKGDIGSLKELTKLTVDQEAALNAITDPTLKAAKAQELLRAQFQGAAEDVNPTFNAIKNLTDAQGDLSQMIGSVIDKSGVVPAVLDPMTAAFRQVEAWVDKNHVTMQRFVISGVDGLVGMVQTAMPYIEGLIGMFIDLSVTIENTGPKFGLIAQAAKIGFLLIVQNAQEMSRDVLLEIQNMMLGIADAIRPFNEDMADMVMEGAEMMSDMIDGLDDGVMGNVDAINAAKKAAQEYIATIDSNKKLGQEQAASVRSAFSSIDDRLAQVRLNLKNADRDAKKVEVRASKKTSAGAAAPDAPKLSGAAGADAAKREAIARKELAVLLEQNAERKAALELDLELLKVKQTAGQTAGERELAQTKAMLDYRETLRALDEEQAASLRDKQLAVDLLQATSEVERQRLQYAYELAALEANRDLSPEERALELKRLELEAVQQLRDARLEDVRAQNAQILAQATQISQLAQASDEVNKLGASFGALGQLTAGLRDIQAEYTAGLITGAQASQQAIMASGSAVVTFADQMGASARTQAVILSLFEAAAAAASYAVGNIPGGIQHTIASGLYAGVAATSAPNAGSPVTGAQLRAPTPEMAASRRASSDYLSERLGGQLGGAGGTTFIYDNRNARITTLDRSPEVQREVFEAATQGGRREGYELTRTKKRGRP